MVLRQKSSWLGCRLFQPLNLIKFNIALNIPLFIMYHWFRLFLKFERKQNNFGNILSFLQEWLDYVIYKSNHKVPKSATLDSFPARTQKPMSFCWCGNCKNLAVQRIPKRQNCETIRNHTDLSDHYPIIGNFEFWNSFWSGPKNVLSSPRFSLKHIESRNIWKEVLLVLFYCCVIWKYASHAVHPERLKFVKAHSHCLKAEAKE